MLQVLDNQMIDEEVIPFLKKSYPDYAKRKVYFSHPYLSIALNMDYFDPNTHQELQYLKDGNIPSGALVLWDNNFALIESGITIEYLMQHPQLSLISNFNKVIDDRELVFSVFESK